MNRYLLLLLTLVAAACGSSTSPSNSLLPVKVHTRGYMTSRVMHIADFGATVPGNEQLSFRTGFDTLTETSARAGYLRITYAPVSSTVESSSPNDTVITIPSDTVDSAAYKAFAIPTNDITCTHDSVATDDGSFPIPVSRVFVFDSIGTGTDSTSIFNHDPSGSQFFITLWMTDTTTVNDSLPNVSFPTVFRSVQRLEDGITTEYTFDLKGAPKTFSMCHFSANQ